MKERPIIFRAEMVRAILAGTKTQTRRIVKPRHMATVGAEQFPILAMYPCGSPGDRLWVRENFYQDGQWSLRLGCEPDDPHGGFWSGTSRVIYAADGTPLPDPIPGNQWRSRPSIHMPRWASRITLEITDVRLEQLQDISEADAVAEGCKPIRPELVQDGLIVRPGRSAVEEFRLVWEEIHGEGSWEKNPWVWVIEFKRLDQQEQE